MLDKVNALLDPAEELNIDTIIEQIVYTDKISELESEIRNIYMIINSYEVTIKSYEDNIKAIKDVPYEEILEEYTKSYNDLKADITYHKNEISNITTHMNSITSNKASYIERYGIDTYYDKIMKLYESLQAKIGSHELEILGSDETLKEFEEILEYDEETLREFNVNETKMFIKVFILKIEKGNNTIILKESELNDMKSKFGV